MIETMAMAVAKRKRVFFAEKQDGKRINYVDAISGGLRQVPEGEALAALSRDYAAMVDDGLLIGVPPDFDDLLTRLADLEERASAGLSQRRRAETRAAADPYSILSPTCPTSA